MAVHLRLPGRRTRYACGVGKRWISCQITSSRSAAAVTCRGCLRTRAASSTTAQATAAPPHA